MVRDEKTVTTWMKRLASLAFALFERLIARQRKLGGLLAAARSISYAATRQHLSHADLKELADRLYREHGVPTSAGPSEGVRSEDRDRERHSLERRHPALLPWDARCKRMK